MTSQNNNIAATIIPTDSGRELLQDIYGGSGSTFTLQHRTQKYKVDDMLSNSDMNAIFNISSNDVVLIFIRENNQYEGPYMSNRYASDELCYRLIGTQTIKNYTEASEQYETLIDVIAIYADNGINQGITRIIHNYKSTSRNPDEFYVEIYKYQTEQL